MDSRLDTCDMQNRLLKLEKQNRRLKQVGAVALLVVTVLLIMGEASQKKTFEADEFILRDNSGNVRARLSMNVPTGAAPGFPAAAQLVLFDEKGKKRVMLDGGSTIPGLSLYDGQERVRATFVETDAFGVGAVLVLEDEKGHLQSRLKEGEVLAGLVDTSTVSVIDAEGFAATLGVTELVTPRTGEKHKTSAASLVLFDKDKNVIWKAP